MLIELHQLSYAYGERWALSEVELTLPEGRIGLLGPNGAGKSTLLRILLGLLRPQRGSGHVLGCPLARLDPQLRRQIGYMPESESLIPGLTGIEYVALAGILCGMPRQEAWRSAHRVLDLLGLDEIRYRRLEEYSTGMKQRLKLAQALVHHPRLLLLDEPTSGLDPIGRERLLDLLLGVTRELQMSVVLSSHILSEVQRVCDQIVVLYQGRVLAQGPIAQLCRSAQRVYRLGVVGDTVAWRQALTRQHAEILAEDHQRFLVRVRDDWPTIRFFELAELHGAVIQHLSQDHEQLDELYQRLLRRNTCAE